MRFSYFRNYNDISKSSLTEGRVNSNPTEGLKIHVASRSKFLPNLLFRG